MSLYQRINEQQGGQPGQPGKPGTPGAPGAPAGPGGPGAPGTPPGAGQPPAAPLPRRDPALADLRHRVHQQLIDELGPILFDKRLSEEDLRRRVLEQLHAALAAERVPLSAADKAQLIQDVSDDILGYGPIDKLLRDEDVTEVMVNGPDLVFVERNGKLTKDAAVRFIDDGPRAPRDRQDRLRGRSPHRRVHARWWTPACPTAPASTPSSRPWPSADPSSPSGSSPPIRCRSTT